MTVLVTGGAGYIGSHAVAALRRRGTQVVVLDNLSRGHRDAVPADVPFHQVDLRDVDGLNRVLDAHRIEAVLHFAALAYVGESVSDPFLYHDVNVVGTQRLFRALHERGVNRVVLSSSCATYGQPSEVPVTEAAAQLPLSPYGWSKLYCERMLTDWAQIAPALGQVALRYFNVAGCAADGSLGERHEPETHLLPLVLQAALGRRPALTVFGTDYDTADGTCVRDYVHVEDLVEAHLRCLDALAAGERLAPAYNIGIGRGYSVREVISAVEQVTGRTVPVVEGARRPGDPAALYASAASIERDLGWRARFTELPPIVETAHRWMTGKGATL